MLTYSDGCDYPWVEETFDLIVCDGRLKAGVAHLTEYLFAEIKAHPPGVEQTL